MVTRASDAPTFTLPGTLITGLTSPVRGGRELSTWRMRMETGAASPPHVLSREEVFVQLHGSLRVTVDGLEVLLEAGDALAVAAGRELQVSNPFADAAEALVCVPAGIEARLLDGTALGTPDWAR
jgi:mannose-6-phosphate isomerase-like protein (cupin superfamily)